MNWLRVRAALLSSVVLVSSAVFARADCGCAAPCAPACAPAYRTVTCQEWVPEHYQTTRTVYHEECVQEKYTCYRTECCPVQQSHQVTVYKSVCETHNEYRTICKCVPETHTECRTICKCVPYCEDRTVMKHVWTCCEETTYTHRCVDKGHWECHEVECGPSLFDRIGRLGRHNDCCCECQCECPRTRTVRCWVPCKEIECIPCTHKVRHCECVPCVEHVTCYRHVEEQISVPVTCYKHIEEQVCVPVSCYHCVPECITQTCTVMVPHQVAYEACRTVKHCVPCQETVCCCRMVCHTVEKQVPCETSCNSCGTTCCESCGHRGFNLSGMFSGLRRHNSCCETCGCESSCGCNTGCGCH